MGKASNHFQIWRHENQLAKRIFKGNLGFVNQNA